MGTPINSHRLEWRGLIQQPIIEVHVVSRQVPRQPDEGDVWTQVSNTELQIQRQYLFYSHLRYPLSSHRRLLTTCSVLSHQKDWGIVSSTRCNHCSWWTNTSTRQQNQAVSNPKNFFVCHILDEFPVVHFESSLQTCSRCLLDRPRHSKKSSVHIRRS